MELFGKVITFLSIGALLIAVAWLERSTKQNTPDIIQDNQDDHAHQ